MEFVRVGSAVRSGSTIHGSGSADPDPLENEADPKQCFISQFFSLDIYWYNRFMVDWLIDCSVTTLTAVPGLFTVKA